MPYSWSDSWSDSCSDSDEAQVAVLDLDNTVSIIGPAGNTAANAVHKPTPEGLFAKDTGVQDWDLFSNFADEHCAFTTVCMVQTPFRSKNDLIRMTEVMFEDVTVTGLCHHLSGEACLMSTGRTTGAVLESRDTITYAMTAKDGMCDVESVQGLAVGAEHLTDFLQQMLQEQGKSVSRQTAACIKDKMCFVAKTSDAEDSSPDTFELPDGEILELDKERFKCPEALFQPSIVGVSGDGIAHLIYKAIAKTHGNASNAHEVFVAGSNTRFDGMAQRLTRDVHSLAGAQGLRILADPQWKHAAFNGASILASLGTFQHFALTPEQFKEEGAHKLVHKLFWIEACDHRIKNYLTSDLERVAQEFS